MRRLIGDKPVMIPHAKEWRLPIADQNTLLSRIPAHPNVIRAESSVDAAQLQAQVVRSSSLPQLNWVINKTTAEDGLGREQPLQTSLAVTWAAFSGGSTRAAERAALQRAEAGRHEAGIPG
ncbi:hypothetical protein PSTG_19413 [Puccinia striiformis f. sp. tritici PST-78]|uniref:Uncharacterized protein n=1 Tax=Puccinia striiformis f. sp. tritici PST-78 TaxID=1165861 RepID=A0A0L0UJL6_9BASI|nr:hypothetical protein PSTG_19413 [Puccinia striiformis f. sp. tritici PST-78]